MIPLSERIAQPTHSPRVGVEIATEDERQDRMSKPNSPKPDNRATNAGGNRLDSLMVTVIVPIYNAEPYLDQCLRSLRDQTHRNLQILCFNDGSTDSSLQIMKRHAENDRRITVIDKPNEGYGATCNRGIEAAEGDWIAIMEPDDWVEPSMYRDMLSIAVQHGSSCDIVKTPYWRITDPDTPHERRLNCSFRRRVEPKDRLFAIEEAPHLLRHHPSIWSAIYRTSFIRKSKIRFHEIPGAGWADNPFLIDTLCATRGIAYFDTPYYCYREQTSEQAADALRKDPLMPLMRWNDMVDSVERLNIDNRTIVDEVDRRAFTYLKRIVEQVGDAQEVVEMAKRSFARMDADAVFDSPIISPASKRLFAGILGIPCRCRTSDFHWALTAMLGEFLYTLRNNGIGYALETVGRTLRK